MTATTADNLMEKFDAGEDVLDYFDTDNAVLEEPEPCASKQISITVPMWLVDSLDAEAERRGIARKAIINTALVEWMDALAERRHERVA